MTHFVFWRKFRVEIPPPPIAMLKANENVINELTSMSSSSNQHCNGGRGPLAVKGSSLRTGKVSFNAKLMCPNEFIRDCRSIVFDILSTSVQIVHHTFPSPMSNMKQAQLFILKNVIWALLYN